MAIVGILIVALYSALTAGFKTEQLDREDIRATQLLIEKMDQLRVISWDQLTNVAVVPTSFTATFNPDDTPTLRKRGYLSLSASTNAVIATDKSSENLVYAGAVTIADAPNDTSYSADMKQITVTLQWKALSGMRRSRSFTTFVARYGMQNYKY